MRWKRKKAVKAVIVLSAILLAVVSMDYVVGYRQNMLLKEKADLKKKLEKLAWYTLRSDIKDVTYEGHKYRITMRFENPFSDEDLYIMTPSIRCLVQVNTYWKEVPVQNAGGKPDDASVVKVVEPVIVEKLMEVPFRNFEEVLPGYMHVRINSISYVSSSTLSKEDIAEKNEDFYIYLKPYFANDREMSKKYTFTGNVVPVWIPMPPH